jgi:hypothetical protein
MKKPMRKIMSWIAINEMLGLALLDPEFCKLLLAEPLKAARTHGFELTDREEQVLQNIKASDLAEFSQMVFSQLNADASPPDS